MRKRFFLSAVICIFTAARIFAEESAEKNTALKGEEIVISASKLSTTSEKSGLSVTVIDSKQIEKSGASKVYELLKAQKGISVSNSSQFGGNTSVFMRGANSDHTVVLIDGIKINDPLYGGFDFANLPLNNIERIEIIRGAQSVVNGSDALGGVINIVTKKARGDEASFSMGYGRYNNRNAALSLSHAGDKTNFSMGASYEKADGFSKAKAKSGSFEDDGYSNIAFNAKGGYDYNDMIGVELYSSFNRSEYDIDEDAYYDDKNYTQKNSSFTIGSGLRFAPVEGLSLKSGFSYFYMDKFMRNDADSSDVENPFYPSDSKASSFSGDRKKAEVSAEYQYDYYRIIGGYEFVSESCENSSSVGGATPSLEVYDYKNHKSAFYVMNSFDYDGYAGISAGVRYTKTSEDEKAGVWHVSAYGNIKDFGTRIRSSAGTGFKNPNLYQLYDLYSGNKDLKSERSIYYDFGVTQKIQKIAEIDAGCFYSKFKKRIGWDTEPPYKCINIDKSSSKGVELSVSVNPVEFLSVFANYTYTISKDDKTDEDMLRRPRHKYSAGISALIMQKTDVSLTYDYTGKRYDTFNYLPVKVDSYSTLNAVVNINTTENTSVFVRIDNIMNKEYEEVKGYDAGGINVRCGLKGRF
ncbi:MAG TPA: TonB-dependent receptor [Spirochaetota bacterium]|nr:TonB-dependent receptor [Spirochaetota bacterium]HOR45136.1 TonB-dependent receptor [Spirochaetota bacterium]HOU84167.1 TonB-dependent receptor [Spirochaetota bacterium]HPK56748.1 TonB-dependent receptor [Spirochaetota bacterium]HQE59139.1 TonB-dependent receptor [Spirochaetota bacterium]